jgi:hypothetical protein
MNETARGNRLPLLFSGIGGLGCLGIVALAALILLCVGGAFFVTSSTLKSSEVVQFALSRARANPAVVDALGTPIEPGWFVSGSISTQAVFGDADVIVPISGPQKGGTLYAAARHANGAWEYYTLAVAVDGRSGLIDLR